MKLKLAAILFCMTSLMVAATSQGSQRNDSANKDVKAADIVRGLQVLDEFIGYVTDDPREDYHRDHRRRGPDMRDHRRDRGLYIVAARYGVRGRFCDATWDLADKCDGLETCHVRAGNHLCGDPARGKDKTLSVRYRCGRQERRAVVQEYGNLRLSCRR